MCFVTQMQSNQSAAVMSFHYLDCKRKCGAGKGSLDIEFFFSAILHQFTLTSTSSTLAGCNLNQHHLKSSVIVFIESLADPVTI